jgi:hypothetical protein
VQLQETMIEVEDANAIKYNPKINNNYVEEVVEEEYNDEEDEEDAEYEMEKVRRNEMLYPGSNQPSVLNSLVNIVRKLVGGTAILAVSSYVMSLLIIMFFSHFK